MSVVAAILFGAASIPLSVSAGAIDEIRAVIKAQQEAWNRGDIDGFMNGYWRSDQTVVRFRRQSYSRLANRV